MKMPWIVMVLIFIVSGCVFTAEKPDWREAVKQDMVKEEKAPDIRYGPEYIARASLESLKPSFKRTEDGNFQMVLQGVYLVPKDSPDKPTFTPVKIRLASALKDKATKTRNPWLPVLEVRNNQVNMVIPNFSRQTGVPVVEKWWGIGLGLRDEPGYLMIDPDDPYTIYETQLLGGYKTKSGDRADLNTLCIAVVMYPDGRILPLREVLRIKGINKTDLEAGPHPELDIPLVPAAQMPQKK